LQVYTEELDHSAGGSDPQILLKDRLKKGSERLDNAIEAMALICEPVAAPKSDLDHIRYFCGNTEIPDDLEASEQLRAALYKAVASLVRSFANISGEFQLAGYIPAVVTRIKSQVDSSLKLREIIRRASGESLDLKAYEADMRHLIDTYIEASEPREISPFDNMPLLELIAKSGIGEAISKQLGSIKDNPSAVAETIENNVRKKIVKDRLSDPDFFDKMSVLLDEIISTRKAKAIEYEEYLKRIADLASKVQSGKGDDTPSSLSTSGRRALYNNLGKDEGLALKIDQVVKDARPDGWRGVQAKENEIKRAMLAVLNDTAEVERVFAIIKAQKEY